MGAMSWLKRAIGGKEEAAEEGRMGVAATVFITSAQSASFGDATTVQAPYASFNTRTLASMRRLVPELDEAVQLLIALIGWGHFEADNEKLAEQIEGFASNVTVGWYRRRSAADRGLRTYIGRLIDSGIGYGYGVGEAVPLASGRGFHSLRPADPAVVRWVQTKDGYDLQGRRSQIEDFVDIPAEAMVHVVAFDRRGSNPWGYPRLWNLDKLCEVMRAIDDGIRKGWERRANPPLKVDISPKSDTAGRVTDGMLAKQKEVVDEALREVNKINSSGRGSGADLSFARFRDVNVEIDELYKGSGLVERVGAEHIRTFVARLASAFHLPAFLFNQHLQSTYAVSKVEADLLVSSVWDMRLRVEPVIEDVTNRWLLMVGAGDIDAWRFVWDPVTLTDIATTAQAQLASAQAQGFMLQNLQTLQSMKALDDRETAEKAKQILDEITIDVRSQMNVFDAEEGYLARRGLSRSFPRRKAV